MPFDPLGRVANDLQVVERFATIRALAWDLTNGSPDQPRQLFGGVEPSSVKLYVQGSPDDGLLTDENDDGVCDDVDTALPIKDLHPVSPEGSSTYTLTTPTSELQLASMPGVTKNGWVCLAVRAEDKTANVGISGPLRIYLSDPSLGPSPPCAKASIEPPSCTRNCTPPPHFRPNIETAPYIRVPE